MKPADFEEKEYESPLNAQLASNGQVWSPGQVLEQHFGFDAALQVAAGGIWSQLGYSRPLKGAVLTDFNWGLVWRRRSRTSGRPLPHFRTNLFLQMKRPHYLLGHNPTLRPFGITGSYFRYQTRKHQQNALERVSRRLGNRALVAYAAPAFHTARELYENIAQLTLVENSNFVRALRLSGHEKWAYNQPGTTGVGLSDPERIEDQSLLEQLEQLRNDGGAIETSSITAQENLAELSASLQSVAGDEQLAENPHLVEFKRRIELIDQNISADSPAASFLRVDTFCCLLGLEWSVVS